MTRSPSALRISLREFLALFGAIAVTIAALKYANPWWLIAFGVVLALASMSAVIMAVLDRGPRQAFAIGFALCLALYGAALISQRSGEEKAAVNPEMDLDRRSSFPTTLLLRSFYLAVIEHWFYDATTGERYRLEQLPPGTTLYNVGLPQELRDRMGTMPLSGGRKAPTAVHPSENVPNEYDFVRIGHMAFGLLLGYIGGHFARFVYSRRVNEQAAAGTG